jgi:Helix-turn-helix domain
MESVKAVSPAKAAAMCGISRTKLYEILNRGIPTRKVGRRTLVLVADIERWLESLPTAKEAEFPVSTSTNKNEDRNGRR